MSPNNFDTHPTLMSKYMHSVLAVNLWTCSTLTHNNNVHNQTLVTSEWVYHRLQREPPVELRLPYVVQLAISAYMQLSEYVFKETIFHWRLYIDHKVTCKLGENISLYSLLQSCPKVHVHVQCQWGVWLPPSKCRTWKSRGEYRYQSKQV